MEYHMWNFNRFVPLRTNSPCYRCGQYHLAGQCRARYAQCNICTKLGHFAVVCWFKDDKRKTVKSKQRDTERMTTFINKKTAEMLPFFGVSTNELTAFFPKNAYMKENHQRELQELRRSASRERAGFLSTQMKLQTKLTDAGNQLTKEQGQRQRAENDRNVLERKLEQMEEKFDSCRERNSNLESGNSKLQGQILDLKSNTETFQMELQNSNRQILNQNSNVKELTRQRNDVYLFNYKFTNYTMELKKQYEIVKQELFTVLGNLYSRDRSYRPHRNFECGRCGSATYHNHANCIARGKTCDICGRPNHLAVVCKNEVMPIEVESSTLALLGRLEDQLAAKVD